LWRNSLGQRSSVSVPAAIRGNQDHLQPSAPRRTGRNRGKIDNGHEKCWNRAGERCFENAIPSLSGSLYVIFEYPVGVPDIASAPGLGYIATEEPHLVFLSADGQDWVRMAANYRLLVEPTLVARTPGMVALFAQPQEPLQPLTPQLRVYPNPFNPRTTIALQNVQGQNVEMAIYNVQGRKVRTLFHGEAASQEVAVDWDGCDEGGRRQASGVYLVRAHSGEMNLRTRVILVK
jgi:hypothetical protein